MGNPKGKNNVRKRAARRRKTERLAAATKNQKKLVSDSKQAIADYG